MRAKVGYHGVIFDLALGHNGHGDRHGREPDFGDYSRRQERRRHSCSPVIFRTCVWTDLLLRGKTAPKMRGCGDGRVSCRALRYCQRNTIYKRRAAAELSAG